MDLILVRKIVAGRSDCKISRLDHCFDGFGQRWLYALLLVLIGPRGAVFEVLRIKSGPGAAIRCACAVDLLYQLSVLCLNDSRVERVSLLEVFEVCETHAIVEVICACLDYIEIAAWVLGRN